MSSFICLYVEIVGDTTILGTLRMVFRKTLPVKSADKIQTGRVDNTVLESINLYPGLTL